MSAQFTVSPDFGPDRIASWYVFNTWFQQKIGVRLHVELYDSFTTQRDAIEAGTVDLIYANPYDAALLVRSHGFTPVVRPIRHADEVILAVAADGPVMRVEDLQPGTRIATTDDPDVSMIGRIMLEPADLNSDNTSLELRDTYVLVAKALIDGRADVGMFLQESFENLSAMVRSRLRPVVTSQISVIHHCLMVSPRLARYRDDMATVLTRMAQDPVGKNILSELGLAGWSEMQHEEAEFLIDVMDTLSS